MAVFLAGLTFGFLLFPIVIVLIFPFLIPFIFSLFLGLLLLFCLIFFLLELLFFEFYWFDFFRSPWGQIALLDGCPGMLYYFVDDSGPAIPHLQALRICRISWFPLYRFLLFFRVFNFGPRMRFIACFSFFSALAIFRQAGKFFINKLSVFSQ